MISSRRERSPTGKRGRAPHSPGRVQQIRGRAGVSRRVRVRRVRGKRDRPLLQSPYVQKTDGRTLDFPGFVAHVRELKRTLKNVKITFERAVAEGANVVSIHRAEAEKVAGDRIAIRVFALFVIDEGKIVLCDELTRLEQGAVEDRDLASRH